MMSVTFRDGKLQAAKDAYLAKKEEMAIINRAIDAEIREAIKLALRKILDCEPYTVGEESGPYVDVEEAGKTYRFRWLSFVKMIALEGMCPFCGEMVPSQPIGDMADLGRQLVDFCPNETHECVK